MAAVLQFAGGVAHAELPPYIVMIHGWAGDRSVWSDVQKKLRRPAVAVDLPGHGNDTTNVAGWPIERFADAVEQVRRRTKHECVLLVAHSNGAYVARAYERRYSKHLAAVVLIDASFSRPYLDRRVFDRQIDALSSHWERFTSRPFGLENAQVATVDKVKDVVSKARLSTAISTLKMLEAEQFWRQDTVEAPVVYVLAKSPYWSDERLAAMRKLTPRSKVIWISGVSHFAQLDAPRLVADTVRHASDAYRCGSGSR